MRIALFGGSFDPPHRGHLQVGLTLLNQDLVDEVWYVPVKQHPFGKQLSSEHDRVAMLEEMITSPAAQKSGLADKLQLSHHELEQDQPSYSFLTLTQLATQHPEHTFSWVIGSDNVPTFSKWYQYQELLSQFAVYVYPRENFAMTELLPGMKALSAAEVTVSSTEVRQAVQGNQNLTSLVEPPVAQYIKDHHLYAATPSRSPSQS